MNPKNPTDRNNEKPLKPMKKRIIFTILTVVGMITLIGVLAGIKGLQFGEMIAQGKQFVPPPETVTTEKVRSASWESRLTAVGSLEAVQGVTVESELTGKIVKIAFESGQKVEAGDLLVQQDTSTEEAQLRAAEAQVVLTKLNLERADELLEEDVIPQSAHDQAVSDYRQAVAQADNIRTIIRKKTIRAPFSGRLGIRLVNLGQNLNESQEIVSLQSLDPIFANFLLPQQRLAVIREGMTVRVTTDVLSSEPIEGRITAINAEVEAATRNIRVQATVSNPEEQLRPGMFVNVAVVMPSNLDVLTIPATAVLYAPYSNSVFVVEQQPEGEDPNAQQVLRQQFVSLGEQRGDFVAVSSGLNEGETVVSTGVFKLRNGQSVVVDNTLAPEFKLQPQPENS